MVDTRRRVSVVSGSQNIMRKTTDYQKLFNNELLLFQVEQLKMTVPQIAKNSGVSPNSVDKALNGTLRTLITLRRVSDTLKVDWNSITNMNLQTEKQFRRAVLNGRAER